jgi:hypothetical protein
VWKNSREEKVSHAYKRDKQDSGISKHTYQILLEHLQIGLRAGGFFVCLALCLSSDSDSDFLIDLSLDSDSRPLSCIIYDPEKKREP